MNDCCRDALTEAADALDKQAAGAAMDWRYRAAHWLRARAAVESPDLPDQEDGTDGICSGAFGCRAATHIHGCFAEGVESPDQPEEVDK